MTETTLITSKRSSPLKIILILIAAAIAVWLLSIGYYYFTYPVSPKDNWFNDYKAGANLVSMEPAGISRAYHPVASATLTIRLIGIILPTVIVAFAILVFFWIKNCELVVTNRRVYGRAAFGKRVDIPLDSISAIAMFGMLKGITVASSSGKISFLLIKNASEIYEEINRILLERQAKTSTTGVSQKDDISDELVKYKALLDQGVITQEEFDVKKKQLLEL